MPKIKCRLRKFGKGVVKRRKLEIRVQDVVRTAALVGLPTLASDPRAARPYLELQWRTALVLANLQLSPSGKTWARSETYDRLDPTEKTAVSYFLGMVQAELTSRAALGYSHLVHVDHLLRLQGSPLTGSRPDFIAIRLGARGQEILGATVEAKGRTNGFSQTALDIAKGQAQKIPMIRNVAASRRIASEAFFGVDNIWASVLEDPYGESDTLDAGLETFLVAYYATAIEAGRESPSWAETRSTFEFLLPGFPLRVSIPAVLVRAYDVSTTLDISEREEQTPLLNAFYDVLESRSSATDAATDLIDVRITGRDQASSLVALFQEIPDEA